jgi:YVTN family beta-propeller protein
MLDSFGPRWWTRGVGRVLRTRRRQARFGRPGRATGAWVAVAAAAVTGTALSTPAAGAPPAGGTVLVANSGADTVTLLDAATGRITATVTVGAKPWHIAVTPNGKLAYVTESGSNTVALLDLAKKRVTRRIVVGQTPTYVLLDSSGRTAYVANAGSDTVSVVKTAIQRVVRTVKTDVEPYALALSPNGKSLYVANCHYPTDTMSTVQIVATSSDRVTATIGGFNCAEGVAATSTTAYVTNNNAGARSIGVIKLSTKRLTGTISVNEGPQCIALGPSRKTVYSTSNDGIFVVDARTNTVARTIDTGSVQCLALSTDGATIYATDTARNLLFVVDAVTGAIKHRVTVGVAPVGVAVVAGVRRRP